MNDDDISKATFKVAKLLDSHDAPEYDRRLSKLIDILVDVGPELRHALHEVVVYLDYRSPKETSRMVLVLREMLDEIESINTGPKL